MPHTILVAEDDPHIREGLVVALESEGYRVAQAADGRAALEAFRHDRPDLVLLDIMMPELSGYDVCRAIRQTDARLPVIMLSAKSEEIDKVVGLELGADDYVAKPFGVRELLARVAAVLRRAAATPPSTAAPEAFAFGGVQVDGRCYRVVSEGRATPISDRELRLLQFFHAHADEVLSRDRLLNAVWGIHYYGTTRTLDQHIAQLRKKLADANAIQTVHGVGYRYVP